MSEGGGDGGGGGGSTSRQVSPHFKLSRVSAITVSAPYKRGAVGERRTNLQIKHCYITGDDNAPRRAIALLVLHKHFSAAKCS